MYVKEKLVWLWTESKHRPISKELLAWHPVKREERFSMSFFNCFLHTVFREANSLFSALSKYIFWPFCQKTIQLKLAKILVCEEYSWRLGNWIKTHLSYPPLTSFHLKCLKAGIYSKQHSTNTKQHALWDIIQAYFVSGDSTALGGSAWEGGSSWRFFKRSLHTLAAGCLAITCQGLTFRTPAYVLMFFTAFSDVYFQS